MNNVPSVIWLVTLSDSTGFYFLKTQTPELWTTEHDDGIAFASDSDAFAVAQALRRASHDPVEVLCSAK